MHKFIAMLIIIAFLAAYIGVAATVGSMLVDAPRWVQLIYFAVAGIAWAFPLKPLFDWLGKKEKSQS